MQEFLSGVTAPMREDCEPCMVKYQDTDAYKKATDEQLRHRDALEKEIRQREADKIQREAWRLDAIDRARAQLAPPIGATGSPRKRGAPPKYPWKETLTRHRSLLILQDFIRGPQRRSWLRSARGYARRAGFPARRALISIGLTLNRSARVRTS
jgi:hypothetical protein